MEDRARMVAAARRMARRIAKKTDLTYQQALDAVARDLGRDHWAHYASDPVPVPREDSTGASTDGRAGRPEVVLTLSIALSNGGKEDPRTEPSKAESMGSEPVLLAGLDWNMPTEDRPWNDGNRFVPGWNALHGRFVGAGVSEADREAHAESIARVLIPSRREGSDYFVEKGRLAMVGLLLAEVVRAGREGRSASIPAMVDWIADGMHEHAREAVRRNQEAAAKHLLPTADGMRDFVASIVDMVRGERGSPRAEVEMLPLVGMYHKERAGILGTVDQGLLIFKNTYVRAANS